MPVTTGQEARCFIMLYASEGGGGGPPSFLGLTKARLFMGAIRAKAGLIWPALRPDLTRRASLTLAHFSPELTLIAKLDSNLQFSTVRRQNSAKRKAAACGLWPVVCSVVQRMYFTFTGHGL
jgi:hypothetical protein